MWDRIGPVLAIVGLLVAAVASFAVPRSTLPPEPDAPEPDAPAPPPPPATPEAAEAFVDAWERSRLGTYVVEWRFHRETADGRELSYTSSLAQRPPHDRLLVGFGAVDGRVDGRLVRCGTDPDGVTRCFPGPQAPPYDDEVSAEVGRLRELVLGEAALYEVAVTDPGCFGLRLVVAFLTPPYGDRATFCFDDATGARTLAVIERPEAVDTTEAIGVRPEVTDADFTLPTEG